ncbi:von willebrand factor [Sarocladium implicatum]|nr:von willebrand factor [Sarocladium implicatum]
MTRSFFGAVKGKLSRSDSTTSSGSPKGLQTPVLSQLSPLPTGARSVFTSESSNMTDQPPPYTPTAGASKTSTSTTQDADPYAFLANFDTVFLIDDSGSMNYRNRWREAEQALRAITPICTSYDSDGVDIYFLNHRPSHSSLATPAGKADGGYYGITSASAVSDAFSRARPSGATPTGQRLRQILRPYLRKLDRADDPDDVKPINIIVITDGRATDEPEEVLVNAAKRLDDIDAAPSQVGVQFFQIGEDEDAAEALRYLDDDLKKRGVRDMVDTCTWSDAKAASRNATTLTSDVILKVVLGAVLRRLDNQPHRR